MEGLKRTGAAFVNDVTERFKWFKDTVLPHQEVLRRKLRGMIPDGYDLDDLVAESLARAYAADGWSKITNSRQYLFRIARNLLIDAARRNSVVSFDFVADLESLQSDSSTERGLTARDELRRIQRIIDTLPSQCKRVFILRRIHDQSLGGIAGEMGLSVSTVEKHLAKAVMLIARAMAESEEWSFERELRSSKSTGENRRGSRASIR